VSLLRQQLKQWFYQLLGKDPEAVVVTFATGDPDLCRRMAAEIRELVPDRRHFLATEQNWPELHRPRPRDADAPAERLAPRRL
jgi:hypothetical protein